MTTIDVHHRRIRSRTPPFVGGTPTKIPSPHAIHTHPFLCAAPAYPMRSPRCSDPTPCRRHSSTNFLTPHINRGHHCYSSLTKFLTHIKSNPPPFCWCPTNKKSLRHTPFTPTPVNLTPTISIRTPTTPTLTRIHHHRHPYFHASRHYFFPPPQIVTSHKASPS